MTMGGLPLQTLLLLHAALAFAFLTFPLSTTAAAALTSSKRGLAHVGNRHDGDLRLLITGNTSVSWYYTWSLYPSRTVSGLSGRGDAQPPVFLPLVHGLGDASQPSLVGILDRLPASSTRLLTFNEPDGDTASGGSAISPADAARSYVRYILPLRNRNGRKWQISHPVVTGSGRGLDWLRDFNVSCWQENPRSGCEADFIAAHWYGDAGGLQGWLDTLSSFYSSSGNPAGPGKDGMGIWVTEMALPQADAEATESMMAAALPALDGRRDVEGYAWFGAFRRDEANAWTGANVALFDGDGGLTELGALYLGGEEWGYREGLMGSGGWSLKPPDMLGIGRAGGSRWSVALLAVIFTMLLAAA